MTVSHANVLYSVDVELDFEKLDPELLTSIGPFSHVVAAEAAGGE